MCNNSAADCLTFVADDLDRLIFGRELDLDKVDHPLSQGCGGATPDGGAVCGYGPRGGPYTPMPGANSRCGEDCALPAPGAPDRLTMNGDFLDPTSWLPAGECAQMLIMTQVGPLTATECICNLAEVPPGGPPAAEATIR